MEATARVSNTVNRAWLRRQIEKGNVQIKCDMVLTDDYAMDSAMNFQKEEGWKTADIKNFNDRDFRNKSGQARWNHNRTEISWTMLCNHYYTCRLIKPL